MLKITNNGLVQFPKAEYYLSDYALLVESGIYSIYDKTINKVDAEKIINKFEYLERDEWLNYFLSPFVNFWLFNNIFKENVQGEEWIFLNFEESKLSQIRLENGIKIYEELPNEFLLDLKSFGIGSKKNDCFDANFLNPKISFYAESVKNIIQAFKLIKINTPGYYTDSINFINSIALVDNNASFRGASGAKRRGLIYFSPDKSWDEYKWAEEIIHETTHCLLDVVSSRIPLLLNIDAFEEKYQAPFRRDKRPLHGNFHALTVISRCITFFDLIKSTDKKMEEVMSSRILDFYRSGYTPYNQLKKDAKFSELGKSLFSSIIEPVFEKKILQYKI